MLYDKKEKEISEKEFHQIKEQAGALIAMFEEKIKDPNRRLALVSALAGYACHRAVMKEPDMTLIMVETKDDRTFYYGDDLNFFLLENHYSVFSFVQGYYDLKLGRHEPIEIQYIVAEQTADLGKHNKVLCESYFPDVLYREMKACWDGIFENMTARICTSSRQWPVLFGVVLQNILLHMDGDLKHNTYSALSTAIYMSKMDEKSLLFSAEKAQDQAEKQLYSFYKNGEAVPLDQAQETFIRTSADTLRNFFKENQMEFSVQNHPESLVKIFITKMLIHQEPTDIYIQLLARNKVCTIDFVCPFKADMFKLTELCQTICKLNNERLTGVFIVNPDSGTISNRVAFPCYAGLKKDDFLMAFIPNMSALGEKMSILKRFARKS